MKTFRLAEYNRIFNLSKFQNFIDWYEAKTGDSFSTKYNKHSQIIGFIYKIYCSEFDEGS